MEVSVQKRRSYDAEFEKNAVLLCNEQDQTVADVAKRLGIPKDLFYRWCRELTTQKEITFTDRGKEALRNRRASKSNSSSRTQAALSFR